MSITLGQGSRNRSRKRQDLLFSVIYRILSDKHSSDRGHNKHNKRKCKHSHTLKYRFPISLINVTVARTLFNRQNQHSISHLPCPAA